MSSSGLGLELSLVSFSISGDKEPHEERGQGNQSGFLCSPSHGMHKTYMGGTTSVPTVMRNGEDK